ncbi:MAG TPA: hypothetical protein VGD99_22145 [Anaerolineae bacterium]|jgi:hypothetical protein
MGTSITDTPIEDQAFTVIWAAPILPGKAEAWRRFMQALLGDRRSDFEDACRRLKIQAMRAWITETARGDIGVLAVIAPQPEQVMVELSRSDLAFDRWLRAQLALLQGLDISGPPRMPPSELVLDWCGPAANREEGGEGETINPDT